MTQLLQSLILIALILAPYIATGNPSSTEAFRIALEKARHKRRTLSSPYPSEEEKKAKFVEVIKETLRSIQDTKEERVYPSSKTDVKNLQCFLNVDDPCSTKLCDTELQSQVLYFLFSPGGELDSPFARCDGSSPHVGYDDFIRRHPRGILTHNTDFQAFERIVRSKHLGKSLKERYPEIASEDVCSLPNSVLEDSRDLFLALFPEEEIGKKYSYGKVFVILPYNMLLVINPIVLKRKDYSVGSRGFLGMKSSLDWHEKYPNRWSAYPEIIFKNPLPLEVIEKIVVDKSETQTRVIDLLKANGLESLLDKVEIDSKGSCVK